MRTRPARALVAVAALVAAAGLPFLPSTSAMVLQAGPEERIDAATIRHWRTLAERGNADAQYRLGEAYRLGRGVPRDLDLAARWLERAGRGGHLEALGLHGLLLIESGRREEGLTVIERAAGRGDPRSQFVYGTALFFGEGVLQDKARGYALVTSALASGLEAARAAIGEMERDLTDRDRARGRELALEMSGDAPSVDPIRPSLLDAPAPAAAAVAPPPSPTPSLALAEPVPAPAEPPASVDQESAEPITTAAAGPAATPPAAEPPPVEAPAPVATATADPVAKATAEPALLPASRPTEFDSPAPEAAPSGTMPAEVAAPGRWRLQLGAFRVEGNARRAWERLRGRLPGLEPFFETQSEFTLLQAGPLPDRRAASRVCAALGRDERDCYPIEH